MPKTKSGVRSKTAHRTLEQMRKHGRTYQARPQQRKNRSKRNAARGKLMKQGRVRKGDGKHVDHKRPMSKGGSNRSGNLRVLSRRANLRKGSKS
jgi:5-methylcytosine-specific restriction endonuclease McrA